MEEARRHRKIAEMMAIAVEKTKKTAPVATIVVVLVLQLDLDR